MTTIHDVEGAKAYLLQHKLHTLFESLAADVISKRPEKPHDYLIERVAAAAKEAGVTTTAKAPGAASGGPAKYKIIFVLGGPGCGKGTQCELMVAQLGYLHVSAGDLLRDEVASGSEGGKAIADVLKNGQLVPGSVTIGLLKKWIEKKPEGTTILVDGFPREMRQALDFENGIAAAAAVLYFKASDDTLSSRLLKRGMTSGRSDDNLESIQKRLATFHQQSLPVVLYFQAKDKVIELDAEKKKEEIFEALKAGLKAKAV